MNANGGIDPGAVAGELAAEVLPRTRPVVQRFTGDATAFVGRYQGPGRGRDLVVEVVTQAPEGPAFSINGGLARPLAWMEGSTFRSGGAMLTFRRATAETGPATELRYRAQSVYGYGIAPRSSSAIAARSPGRPALSRAAGRA